MTAISGLIRLEGRSVDISALERMKNLLVPYGREAQHMWHESGVGLVRALWRTTPEDSLDRQPLKSRDGHWVLVADARIDNRDDLARKLDIPSRQANLMADSGFILEAFRRWRDDCVEHLLGSFSFAVWDRHRKRLVLARDPLGFRPLYWHRGSGFFAFATLPKGLFALPEIPREICEERLIDLLALLPMTGPESFYKGIYRVEPGSLLILEGGKTISRRYHRFDPEHRIILRKDDDYVDMARELLEKAVTRCLRANGPIASQLSSGLDSSTVTSTAARLLAAEGKPLTAYTAVPRQNFNGPVPKGRHGDEGPGAAAVAARFSNIRHILMRPEARTPMDTLERDVEALDRAPLNLCNHAWINAIHADAANRGHRVMLTAQMGNMTISYAGMERLPALLGQGRIKEWLTEAIALKRRNGLRWRGVLAGISLAPFLPPGLWRLVSDLRGKGWRDIQDYTAIHDELIRSGALQERIDLTKWDVHYQPWSNGRKMRTAVLYRMDGGDYSAGMIGTDGVEIRDPTADQELVSFCLAIPEDQYLKNGRPRWLLLRLMKDVLPPEILFAKTKGLQAPDWYEGVEAAMPGIMEWLDRLENSPQAGRYLDTARMRKSLGNWPQGGWDQEEIVRTYRLRLLRGLAVGAFIHHVEGGNR